jgi:hypothetical protein
MSEWLLQRKIVLGLMAFGILAIGLTGCGGGGGGSGPDNPAPVITGGPATSGLTSGAVTITWTTKTLCDSKVLYGKTTSYADSAASSDMVTQHSVDLTGLDGSSLYHYKVVSEDAGGAAVSSGDKIFTTLSVVEEAVGRGWQMFENADYVSALAKFAEAYALEPHNVAVLEGRGWCLLRLYRFDESLAALQEALSIQASRLDCLVASAFTYEALERYSDSIVKARRALELGGNSYVFAHSPEIKASDVRYCLVVSLMATGDLAGALAEAKIIDPAIDLDSGEPSTWNGYPTFEEALLEVVEQLRQLVQG